MFLGHSVVVVTLLNTVKMYYLVLSKGRGLDDLKRSDLILR